MAPRTLPSAGAGRLPEVARFRGLDRISTNTARRVRRSLPLGSRTKWKDTLEGIEGSALLRNIVVMSCECTTDEGRYAFAEELIDAIDRRLSDMGVRPELNDRLRAFTREVSEAEAAVLEIALSPNDPSAKARAREEVSEAKRAADQLGDALADHPVGYQRRERK